MQNPNKNHLMFLAGKGKMNHCVSRTFFIIKASFSGKKKKDLSLPGEREFISLMSAPSSIPVSPKGEKNHRNL